MTLHSGLPPTGLGLGCGCLDGVRREGRLSPSLTARARHSRGWAFSYGRGTPVLSTSASAADPLKVVSPCISWLYGCPQTPIISGGLGLDDGVWADVFPGSVVRTE